MEKKKERIAYIKVIPVFIIIAILFKMINNGNIIGSIFGILSPFIAAFSIAYLVNPLVILIERRTKLKRGMSILVSYLVILGIVGILIYIVTPSIAKSITDLVSKMPEYMDIAMKFLKSDIYKIEALHDLGIIEQLESITKKGIEVFSSMLTGIIDGAVSQAISATSLFFKAILSLTMSVYILKDKENFIFKSKRMIYAFAGKEDGDKIMDLLREIDDTFLRFLIGKMIDSIIIGIICFVVMSIIKVPYVALISAIVGVTNMIPYFGPFIGGGPAILIALFASPVKAIWVALAILGLQQFDGLYLGPKILGEKVGVKPFWIVAAITIGGGMFGVIGMLLGVPAIAVIKNITERTVERKLEEKNIDLTDQDF